MPNRRDFIVRYAAAGTLALTTRLGLSDGRGAGSRSLRILMIGGTGFVGSHHVRVAAVGGHHVTVFSRDEAKTKFPADVETIVGDRYKDLHLVSNRDWDEVVDFAAYTPLGVRTLGKALGSRVKHYTLISSNAVYDNPVAHDVTTEVSPLLSFEGKVDPYSLTDKSENVREYGSLKALCEREAERQFPQKTLILRPGLIFGPGKPGLILSYWPARMERGGEMLAAGYPEIPVQFVDVRDLAAWSIRMVERRATGVYNVLGPTPGINLGQLIAAARDRSSASPELVWVSPAWLAERQDRSVWGNLLGWTYGPGGYAGMMRMSAQRALAEGFSTTPPSVTIRDTYNWYKQQTPERQAPLLAMQRTNTDSARPEMVSIGWPEYLQREAAVVADWRSIESGGS